MGEAPSGTNMAKLGSIRQDIIRQSQINMLCRYNTST
jgi:hypothetical protein